MVEFTRPPGPGEPIASALVATKKEVQKRRVQAARRAEAQAAATARKDRRRRMVVGGLAGIVAIAMVASLGVGFLAGSEDPDDDGFPVELEDAPQPVELVAPAPGATITGETPCPATDGTQERTTAFETPPPMCIDENATYDATLATSEGEIVVSVDLSDADAANLFLTNSWYGVYDDVPFWLVIEDGLAITGDTGDGNTGFTIPAREAARAYEAGDVIMWADQTGGIGSQFAIVASDLIAATLNSVEPAHPIIGRVITGTEVVASIIETAGAPGGIQPLADVRISDVAVAGGAS